MDPALGEGASSLLATVHLSRRTAFVVNYDLPADYRRKRFYRAIRRYLRDHGLEETGWSTWSVVWTRSEHFAWYIYHQARKVGGTAHVWRAERLDSEP